VKENNMPKGPLDVIEANDHDLFEQIARARDLALTEEALSLKHKLLIALALDASHGAVDGLARHLVGAPSHGVAGISPLELLAHRNISRVNSMRLS
jgi:alkylhydroperoxidase/carboxymuconolactone decarboxylase family protein YurZ